MAGIFSPKSAPAMSSLPQAPSLSDDIVQQAADEAAKTRQRQGRASTFLTNPETQREAQASQQTYLGGI